MVLTALAAAWALASPSRAQEVSLDVQTAKPIKGVIELFTSQGCSSCPRPTRSSKRCRMIPQYRALAARRLLGLSRLEGHVRVAAQQRASAKLRPQPRRRRDFHAASHRQRRGARQRRVESRDPAGDRRHRQNGRTDASARPVLAGAQYPELRVGRRCARTQSARSDDLARRRPNVGSRADQGRRERQARRSPTPTSFAS